MAQKTIFTIGFELPTSSFLYKEFHSSTSLLDADIILFKPILEYSTDYRNPTYKGKPNLSETSSSECINSLLHWREELRIAFESGKTIFIFLSEYEEVYYDTGEKSYSGTGRNQKVTNLVSLLDSYNSIPLTFVNKKVAHGKNIKFSQNGSILKSYWDIAKDISEYKLYFEVEKIKPLLITKSGDKTVGGFIKGKNGGHMILLPPFKLPDTFTKVSNDGKSYLWSDDAIKFGKNLLNQVIAIDKTLKSKKEETPPPEWLNEEKFKLDVELKYFEEIEKLEEQILKIKEKINTKKELLQEVQISKKLLYENGKPLEESIIDALVTIGFKAENYDDGESEFDIVFESKEGRFIGEAEGKDNAAINVTKFRQLNSNIDEDYEREEVNEHAKGILFGNAQRLRAPNERDSFFTDKAISSAKRSGIALVNTFELFEVVKYLKKKKDRAYAKKVRECFRDVEGEIIKFPDMPKT